MLYQQVSLEEGSLGDKYYYRQIPEADHKAYQEVLEGLREHQEEIYVHCEKPRGPMSSLPWC